jgi:hypothetical protein
LRRDGSEDEVFGRKELDDFFLGLFGTVDGRERVAFFERCFEMFVAVKLKEDVLQSVFGKSDVDPRAQVLLFIVTDDERSRKSEFAEHGGVDFLEHFLGVERFADVPRKFLESVQTDETFFKFFLGFVEFQVRLDDESGLFIQVVE